MNDVTGAPAGGESAPAPVTVITPAPETGADLSISQAARALAAARHKPREQAPVDQPQADPGEQPELAQANADPQHEAPGEASEATDPAEMPPIEPPRSWTKAEKERFQSLPRETQEYLHTREQEREREVRRSQNEAAELRKAAEAERTQAEQVRQQYEAKLPALMQAIHDSSPFADIKSLADVEKLQAEDPFRFQQFQIYQWKMQGVQADLTAAEQRKATEAQTKWTEHVQTEDAKFAESLSEADKKNIGKLMSDAPQFLEDRGFSQQELSDMWNGKERLSLRDHRVQALILDGMKYRDIQKAKTAATAKPLPPVQRPGTSKPSGSSVSAQIQALQERFNQTGSLKDAQALRVAQSNARRAS